MRNFRIALSRCLSFLFLVSIAAASQAATVEVFGADGTPGANVHADPNDPNVLIPPTAGTPGSPATAVSSGADAANEAISHGGVGGAGGFGGFNLPGAAGAAGGAASSTASSLTTADDARAESQATAGAGGAGGAGATGPAGADGGAASALATAHAASGSATALANAAGGAGGLGGESISFTSTDVVRADPGLSGLAQAQAEATSEAADATASATATAGDRPNYGATPPPSLTSADAVAHSNGAGTAWAESVATGASATPNGARATASAFSAQGDATASTKQIAGPAQPVYFVRSGQIQLGGSAGVDSLMTDQVSGSAAGHLTLHQEAVASSASDAADGGRASSALHASNPGGGALSADVTARGGRAGRVCVNLGSTSCSFGSGGNADASGEAIGSPGTPVAARAHAIAGQGIDYVTSFGGGSVSNAGAAAASATASGSTSALAAADATTGFGAGATASAHALGSGAVLSASSNLLLTSAPPFGFFSPISRTATAHSGFGVAFERASAPASAHSVHGELFATPLASDVASFLDGSPNAQQAALTQPVLALGSLGGTLSASVTLLHAEGSLVLEVAPDLARETLSLAFLDPTATGSDAFVLDLSLSGGGEELLHLSYTDPATALAELDDAVFSFASPGGAPITLSWLLDYSSSEQPQSFDVDFALLASSAVPEPSAALLALVGLGLALRRR